MSWSKRALTLESRKFHMKQTEGITFLQTLHITQYNDLQCNLQNEASQCLVLYQPTLGGVILAQPMCCPIPVIEKIICQAVLQTTLETIQLDNVRSTRPTILIQKK